MRQQEYELRPLDGVGPIKLGMTREETQKAMGQTHRTFRKYLSNTETDTYHGSAFQIFFDEQERVEFIELSRVDALAAMFQGTDLLHTPADEVVSLLSAVSEFDSDHPTAAYTYVFPQLELTLWRRTIPEEIDDLDDEDIRELVGYYFDTAGIGRAGYLSRRRT